MKIDAIEIAEIAAVAPRLDLYAGIHKALRAWMAHTLLAAGRVDVDDDAELAEVGQRVTDLLEGCRKHLMHENRFVHAAMEARAPGTSRRLANEHEQHTQAIAQLESAVQAMLSGARDRRPALSAALYRELALFVGHNFEHMHVEETDHNAVLWAHYSDEELLGIHAALLATIPPQEVMTMMRWMIPALSPAERAGVLADMRAHAPAPAFAAVLGAVRPHLAPADWAKLARVLELPPEPQAAH